MIGQTTEFQRLFNSLKLHKDNETEQLRQQLQQEHQALLNSVYNLAEQAMAEKRANGQHEAQQREAVVTQAANAAVAEKTAELDSIRRQPQQQFDARLEQIQLQAKTQQ